MSEAGTQPEGLSPTFAEDALKMLERFGNKVRREETTRAGKVKALRNKIGALELAALNPALESAGGGGYPQMITLGTTRIEKCAEEALALVDELFGEVS